MINSSLILQDSLKQCPMKPKLGSPENFCQTTQTVTWLRNNPNDFFHLIGVRGFAGRVKLEPSASQGCIAVGSTPRVAE
jgi:hypothetical protein